MGLHHVTAIVRPNTLDEALGLVRNAGGTARWLAGGIDIVRQPPPEGTTLIDISALPLHEIAVSADGQTISIGATATLTEIMESKLIRGLYGGEMVAMLSNVASPLLRNLATLGGSIGSAHPWSDIHCFLEAVDAKVEIFDGSYRTVDLADVSPQRSMQNRLFTRVLIPVPADNAAVAFEEFSRSKFDVSMLNCACSIAVTGGKVAEERLLETELGATSIQYAADAAASDTVLRDDIRASAEYRRVLLKTGIRRCLLRARTRTTLANRPFS